MTRGGAGPVVDDPPRVPTVMEATVTQDPPSVERALIVGSGSIGVRHRAVLEGLGVDVRMLSRRPGVGDFVDAMEAVDSFVPGYVVVATEPDDHVAAVDRLAEAGFAGRMLVEKPFAERTVEDPSDDAAPPAGADPSVDDSFSVSK